MKKRTNLLALVLSITAITFTLFGCSSDTGQKKSIAAPGSATETGGGGRSLNYHIYNAESYDTIADSDAITFMAKKNN